ncbi:MAG TPA: SGNH/GDSL hydrolase family protein [Planctomycetota bacterium]|nr:SGNH/GDSL hydrolase family protein [Planctomycetota bacterium]
MSRESLAKLAIVLVTAAVCGGLLWWSQAHAPAGGSGSASVSGGAGGAPGDGAGEGMGGALPPGAADTRLLDPASLPGTVLDEATATTMFRGLRIGEREMYDPVAYVVLKPSHTSEWKWPEHPTGKILMVANNLGFREDTDTQVEKQGPRVLVAGDSQTDGLVWNTESFSNVLEDRLNARPGAVRCEVINAGVGGSGPQNYLGTLKRNLYLKPDVFVAVLFTGNDFVNALAVSDFFTKRKEGQGKPIKDYQVTMMAANKKWGPVVLDRFNQALKFQRFPEDADIALKAAVDAFLEMARICRDEHIEFLVAILPVKADVDTDEQQTFHDLIASLHMTEEEFRINQRLGDALGEALRAQGVRVLDLAPGLRADPGVSHYWVKDWHLNVNGHALVARLLQPVVEPLLPR